MIPRDTDMQQLLAWVEQEMRRREAMNTFTDVEYARNEGAITALEDVQDWIAANAQ